MIGLVSTLKESKLSERKPEKLSGQKDQESLNKLVQVLTKISRGKKLLSVMVDGQNMQWLMSIRSLFSKIMSI
jgi:hypothetical protein